MTYTEQHLKKELQAFCKKSGGMAKGAQLLGVTAPFISEILKGNKKMSRKIAAQLGYKPIKLYVRT